MIISTLPLVGTGAETTLMDCKKIEDVEKRVACYDRVAGRVEEKMKEDYRGTTDQRTEARNQSITQEVVGTVQPPATKPMAIDKVLRDRNRRIVFVTTDGRRFRKRSSSPTSFRPGDTVRLEDGVFGSVFLVNADGLKIKVKEIP
ncbi:MAG: hypothetical protein HUJ31_11930 [Pseudomonadales bacterium]|nr:hypothetical protein [Pseudomonadales bacterium]